MLYCIIVRLEIPKYQQTDTNIKLNTKYNIHYVHISKKMMFNDISMSY